MFKRTSRSDDKFSEPRDKAAEKLAKRAERRAKSVESRANAAEEPQVYRKPRADIYTVMLSIALIAVALAAAGLWMTMGDYHYEIKGGPNPSMNRPAAPAAFDSPRAVV